VACGLGALVAKSSRPIDLHGEAVAGAKAMDILADRNLDRSLKHPNLLLQDGNTKAAVVSNARAGRQDDLDQLNRRRKGGRRKIAPDIPRFGVAPCGLIRAP